MISTHNKRMNHGLFGLLFCSLIVGLVYLSANLTTSTTFHSRRKPVPAENYYGQQQQEEFDINDPFHNKEYYKDKAFVTIVTDPNLMDATRVSIQSLQKVSKTRANIMVIMAINNTFSNIPVSYDDNIMKNIQLLNISPDIEDPISEALIYYRKLVYFSNEILFKKNVDHYFGYPTHTILKDHNNIGLKIYERSEKSNISSISPLFTPSTHFPLSNEEIFWFKDQMKPWNFHQYHDTDWLKNYHSSSFYQWRRLYDDIIQLESSSSSSSSSVNDWSNQDRRKSVCNAWTLSSLEKNSLPTTLLNDDKAIIIRDRFSVLLSTYKPERINHLTLLIRHLLQSSLVHEIFITWHNPNLDVPTPLMEFIRNDTNSQGGERIHVLPQSYDSLNNRFNPVKQIQTEAVYILDDDVFMDIQDLEFTFSVWQQPNHKDSIVGHFPRIHQYNSETHEAIYKISNKDIYSMVLTKSMFVRTEYLFTFTCLMDLEIHHAIDSWMNCEDIAFNMMVSGMTGAPAIAVTPGNPLLDFGTKSGISTNLQHMGGRGECISHFITKYWKEKDPLIVSSSAIVPYERPSIRRGSWDKIEKQINHYQHRTEQ